jgi:hypothetical protein
MGAATTEVASSHVPMLSNPGVVIDVSRKAATTAQAGTAMPGKPDRRPSP